MQRRRMIFLLLLLLLLVIPVPALATDGVLEINQTCVQTGCFSGDVPGWPVSITAPGSYRLTSNLIVPDKDTSGIQVAASDVGIDLNHFAIIRAGCEDAATPCTASPQGAGSGVFRMLFSHRGISVKNGSITGMGSDGLRLGDQAHVSNVRVRWNGGTGMFTGDDAVLSGNIVYSNGLGGIVAENGAIISGNTVSGNGADGIGSNNGSAVLGNTVYQNGSNGIVTSTGSTIIDNTAFGNGTITTADGIKAFSGCTIRGNNVRGNSGYGLRLTNVESPYSDNVVTGNATGTVIGLGSGDSLGGNYCAGTGTGSSSCP
jgi:hypothetical protein